MGKAEILENVMGLKRDLGLVRSRSEFSMEDLVLRTGAKFNQASLCVSAVIALLR